MSTSSSRSIVPDGWDNYDSPHVCRCHQQYQQHQKSFKKQEIDIRLGYLVRVMMDNHHFPINNRIARYVLAVQCIGQVKFGLKIKDHSNHYHHLLQYQQVYTTAVLLLKIQKAQNTKTKATTTTTTTTTTMILTKTSN